MTVKLAAAGVLVLVGFALMLNGSLANSTLQSIAPDELRGALERAIASGKPALVNVLTDPGVVYPRSANLA